MASSQDWQVKVTRFLIEGGTQGRKQSDLIRKANGYVEDAEVIAFLMGLAHARKANKYVLPNGVIQWRATINIQSKG